MNINNNILQTIKTNGLSWIETLLKNIETKTKPGSIAYLLYGEIVSEQSINIKLGKFGEYLTREIIQSNNQLEILKCGIQKLSINNKDVDLIWKNNSNNTIYYRELKANINLDTEKLPATIKKCLEIDEHIKTTYADYNINSGILNWSIYDEDITSNYIKKKIASSNLVLDNMQSFLKTVDIEWPKDDYYTYFRAIGDKIKEHRSTLIINSS